MNEPAIGSEAKPKLAWKSISAIDRRVLGVLVEKAKTTPDIYPLSLNALTTGCNQKSNRDPVMQLSEDDVEESLARLRPLGAVEEVQGSSRVTRFRHHMYEWMGVEKIELAVMTELLLRGAQTEGELRGRAARMEPIPDLNALRPILSSLKQKELVISLTPESRGHVVSHALYLPGEMEKLRTHFASAAMREPSTPTYSGASSKREGSDGDSIRSELDQAREQIAQLRRDLDELASNFRRSEEELHRLKVALGA